MSSQTLYSRFWRRLLPLLALAYVLAAAITAGLYYQGQLEEASEQRRQTLQTFANVLIKPLWDCNSLTARGIIEALMLQHDVRGVSALDQCAQQPIHAGVLPGKDSKDTLSTPLRYIDEAGRAHALGELRIAFQPISIFTAAARGLAPQLAVFLSMLTAVLASTLWTLGRTVGQPLSDLRRAMRDHQTLDPIPPDWTEELTEVTQTYNTQLRELRRQARRDPLTGLANRLLLEEHMERALIQAKRTGACGRVLVLDLNKFKQVNDTLGHAAGDELLRTVAQRLLACVRSTDIVARLGGDEFVVVTSQASPDTAAEEALTLIARIREVVNHPAIWEGTPMELSISIGVASFGKEGGSISALLQEADANMYLDKARSRQAT
ncbi:GGDEF domain-containing protein [Achromobacter sp. F4_2707]|uniref:GGDEF domain-containing protein n=1 Tax=Achromobacter sp. F4_2707 TaxID=3114286 RepID=UPI0039C6AF74